VRAGVNQSSASTNDANIEISDHARIRFNLRRRGGSTMTVLFVNNDDFKMMVSFKRDVIASLQMVRWVR